jgi:hypothetical protein
MLILTEACLLSSLKNEAYDWAKWHAAVIPCAQGAEAGGLSSKPCWAQGQEK